MRIVHSFWTKPAALNRWYVNDQIKMNIWIYALSIAYLKKIDVKKILHTDSVGKELLGFLPYDEIHLTLNVLNDLNIHERIWAAGKIWAQEAEPIGSLHIDGDVFIKTEKLRDLIFNSKKDLVTQNIEYSKDTDYYEKQYSKSEIKKVIPTINEDEIKIYGDSSAVNCGIVRFNNKELKTIYIKKYKEYLKIAQSHMSQEKMNDLVFTPDLIIEQWNLYNIIYTYDYTVECLFNKGEDIQKKAREYGYAHMFSRSKYEKINEVKNRLKEVDIDIYNSVLNKIIELELKEEM